MSCACRSILECPAAKARGVELPEDCRVRPTVVTPAPEPRPRKEPRKPTQRAEDCVNGGDATREVPCRICSSETVLRPVYRCDLFGEAMNRRNEHNLMDCSRCGAFTQRSHQTSGAST